MRDTLKLHAAANAIDNYNIVKQWIDEYGSSDLDISISWHKASACPGYKETSKAVEIVIKNDIVRLLRIALENTELSALHACTNAGIEFNK